jgi:hypothetical protein
VAKVELRALHLLGSALPPESYFPPFLFYFVFQVEYHTFAGAGVCLLYSWDYGVCTTLSLVQILLMEEKTMSSIDVTCLYSY